MARARKPPTLPEVPILRSREDVVTVDDILTKTGIGRATFYRWLAEGRLQAPLGKLQQRGRKGNNPVIWDISILAQIERIRGKKTDLPT